MLLTEITTYARAISHLFYGSNHSGRGWTVSNKSEEQVAIIQGLNHCSIQNPPLYFNKLGTGMLGMFDGTSENVNKIMQAGNATFSKHTSDQDTSSSILFLTLS